MGRETTRTAWFWVRGVAALLAVGFAGCERDLELLGEMNSSSLGGEAGASDSAGGGSSGGAFSGAGTFSDGGTSANGGTGAQSGSFSQTGGEAGAPSPHGPTPNYEYSAMWPTRPIAYATKPGQLKYTKLKLHDRFLAESCAIADYNDDGLPDVSSGRRWYEQGAPKRLGGPPSFTEHVFRGGHDDLPRTGDSSEVLISLSDDQSDFPFDVDGDGDMDVINLSNPLAKDADNPSPAPAPQPAGTAYWYENPGRNLATQMWTPHLIQSGVHTEQHGFADLNGDGMPEIFGGVVNDSWGFYQAKQDPKQAWTYHPVSAGIEGPFYGVAHGAGFGDVDGDGRPDLLQADGVFIDVLADKPNGLPCPTRGCGFIPVKYSDLARSGSNGPAQIYAADMDDDGDADLVAADYAHGDRLSWHRQIRPGVFEKRLLMDGEGNILDYAIAFTEPHALAIADMDGDGTPDILSGKTHYSLPHGYGVNDQEASPVIVIWQNKHTQPDILPTLGPYLIDEEMGVGFQIGVGHLNDDGIMDFCVATKLGLAVFLGE